MIRRGYVGCSHLAQTRREHEGKRRKDDGKHLMAAHLGFGSWEGGIKPLYLSVLDTTMKD